MIDSFSGEHAFLSNFFPAEVAHNNITFRTVEHAFQAAKTLDPDEMRKIAAADTPGKAKRLGRTVTLRPNWNIIRVGVMEELVRQKFANPALATLLVATGDEELVEGNNHGDAFWGVYRGKGDNWLGKILMKVRSEIAS